METNPPREENDENVGTKPVKEIVEPATAVQREASVQLALAEMRAHGHESAAVTDQGSKLLGGVSKTQLNRKVGGFGHDPQVFPVEPQMDKDVARCFEDQTIGEAEKVMRDAKVDEVPVVTQEISLVGKATLGAIEKKKAKSRELATASSSDGEQGAGSGELGQKSEAVRAQEDRGRKSEDESQPSNDE